MMERPVAVSVVSHGHGAMVESLIDSLQACPSVGQIILTQNLPETIILDCVRDIRVISNPAPKGFGTNHNAAFAVCDRPFFCVLNPDVEFTGDPFAALVERLSESSHAALAAPAVVSPGGRVEDSARRFPSITGLVRKALFGDLDSYAAAESDADFFPDWVAGMFMLFRSSAYGSLGGFDARYFLYYEDVDICVRAWKAGMTVLACPSVYVIHDARRDSRKRFDYMRWHLASMARYFFKYWGRLPHVPGNSTLLRE